MKKIDFNKDKYNNLTNINWTEHVDYATIKFVVLTGKRKGQEIIIKHRVEGNMELYDSLVKDDIIIATDYTKRYLREGVQRQVQAKVNKHLFNYNRGINIYNELAELDVKDKRRDNYTEHVVDGKVSDEEIKIVNRVESLSSIEFHPNGHDCLYDYKRDDPSGEKYIYKKTWAHNSVTEECCDIYISFCINHINHGNNQEFYLPDVEVTAKYKEYFHWEKRIKDAEIDLICASSKDNSQLTFNSYRLQNSSRKVSLNMFMVYVRETTKENIFRCKDDTSRQSNLDTQMDVLVERFPNEKVSLEHCYKRNLTHNYHSYWGRTDKECIRVLFKDESYILYNKELAQKDGKLEVVGVYDSQHEFVKEGVAIEKLIIQNN
tara:strand:+ start:1158 stop:2285 length:1128 start_codon:yes stop_codon:yes gene_type:complete